jgi:hypothetical protein
MAGRKSTKGSKMYNGTNENVDKYKQMERMIDVILPSFIAKYGRPELACAIIQEFANMEMARGTIAGVPDTAVAAADYVTYHFSNGKVGKPFWYEQLTGK